MNFTAIDFETANPRRYSACAVGLVRVEGGCIVEKRAFFIRPPERWFRFTHIHGITWDDVKDAPTFRDIWPDIEPLLSAGDFLAAHNAPFDRSVLLKTCEFYRITPPPLEFRCTVQIARKVLGISPANLPEVCRRLDIRLDNHHEALADAMACARIMLYAGKISRAAY